MRPWALMALAVGMAGAATAAAVPAQAEVTSVDTVLSAADPEDVQSRLDIVFERFRGNGDGTATLAIRTADSWGCRYLGGILDDPEDTLSAALIWDFDVAADGHFGDVVGSFSCERGRFSFHVHHPGGQHRSRTFSATRPTRRSVVVTMPLRVLHAEHLRLRAVSRTTGIDGERVLFEEDDHTPALRAY